MKSSKTALILCVNFAIFARSVGILYSVLATDVAYSSGILCRILPSVRQLLSALSYTAAAGGAVLEISCGRSRLPAVLYYLAVLLADGAAVILYDYFSGVLDGRMLLAILYRTGLILYSVAAILLGCTISKFMLKRGFSTVRASMAAALLPIAVDLISVIWRCITSLIEWDFLPYSSEVISMTLEIVAVLISGVLSALLAVLTVRKKQPHL